MSFFEELKRRHVIRVAAIYIALGWLLAQVADFAAETFLAPDWVVQMFTVLVVLGFPLVLIGAWAFELTPEGLKRDTGGETTDGENEAEEQSSANASAPAGPAEHSIAVLPFVNMSSDVEQEYFSDGLSEELLNLLAHVPELHVAARTSSFSFKGKDLGIQEIAQKLNVAHVLEGSVRTAGNRVRITAQLIKAEDGYHLWSETFDKTLDDFFAIQDEIAKSVVGALKVTLLGEVPTVRETNPEAYALFLQGRHIVELRNYVELKNAGNLFRQALEIDPEYAPAWDGLAEVYALMVNVGQLEVSEGLPLARQASERALELDDSYAEAHGGMAFIKQVYDWDWAGAQASLDRGLELAPGMAKLLLRSGHVAATLGRFEKAIDILDQAIALDPLLAEGYIYRALFLLILGRVDESVSSFKRALEINPLRSGAHSFLGLALCKKGDVEAALAAVQKETDPVWREYGLVIAEQERGQFEEADARLQAYIERNAGTGSFQIAEMYANRGKVDEAFEWLDRAYDERDGGLPQCLFSVYLRPLYDDPRWPVLLEKLKLPWPVPEV